MIYTLETGLRKDVHYDIDNPTDLNDGQFSSDGILVELPLRYLKDIGIPFCFDIDVVGPNKPNLTITRDKAINDKKLRALRDSIIDVVGEKLYEMILAGNMSDTPVQRYQFIARLACDDPYVYLMKRLLAEAAFKKDILLMNVQKGTKQFYLSLPDIIERLSGKVYLSEASYYSPRRSKHIRDKPLIDGCPAFLIDLFAKSSEVVFFIANRRDESYFELLLSSPDDIKYGEERFTFAKYLGKNKHVLFCENRLNALNINHPLCRMYLELRGRSDVPSKKMLAAFEKLFHDITSPYDIDTILRSFGGYWKMDDKRFDMITKTLSEVKMNLSSLKYAYLKDLHSITITRNDV